jgi:hypothetical protein
MDDSKNETAPQENSSQPTQQPIADSVTRELVRDAENLASVRHDAFVRTVTTLIAERVSFLRDLMYLSLPVLIVSFALYIYSSTSIKTDQLFIGGILLLGLCQILGVYTRHRLLSMLDVTIGESETYLLRVVNAARNLKGTFNSENIQALTDAENREINTGQSKWIDDRGHKIYSFLYCTCIAMIVCAVLFEIKI